MRKQNITSDIPSLELNEKFLKLIERIKKNDLKAALTLTALFKPLIIKTCRQVYRDINRTIDLKELLRDGRHALLYLATMQYDPSIALFTTFIKKHLYARVINFARPTATFRIMTCQLKHDAPDNATPYSILAEKESEDGLITFERMVSKMLTPMDRHILADLNGLMTTREIAAKHGLNINRVNYIKREAMRKLALITKTLRT